jgi:hypothetical protein
LANSGARGLSLNRVVIPAGGRVEIFYGTSLEKSMVQQAGVQQAGDFLFIPADLPPMPVNLSDSEIAVALVARNDPNEQEQVERIADGIDHIRRIREAIESGRVVLANSHPEAQRDVAAMGAPGRRPDPRPVWGLQHPGSPHR